MSMLLLKDSHAAEEMNQSVSEVSQVIETLPV
jgi:hypothetical protein